MRWAMIDAAFEGTDDENLSSMMRRIRNLDDAKAVAAVLVDLHTMSEVEVDVTFPEDYHGVDAYVEAAQLEFAYNLLGESAPEEEILALFH